MKHFVDNVAGLIFLSMLTFLIWEQAKEYIQQRQSKKGAGAEGGVLFGCICLLASVCVFPAPNEVLADGSLFFVLRAVCAFVIFVIALIYFRESTTKRVEVESVSGNLELHEPTPSGNPA